MAAHCLGRLHSRALPECLPILPSRTCCFPPATPRSLQSQQQGYSSSAEVPRDSVYSLAINAAGSLLAAGSTQSGATLVDARSGRSVMHLQGHTENIR